MIYKNLQLLLLSMKDDNSIDIVKSFIDENNLFSESLNLSTLRLIGSVVYSRPEILSKAVKLLNKFDSISIKSDIINDNLSDFEVIYRYSSILKLLFLIDNGNFRESLIFGLRAYTNGGYNDTFYSNDIEKCKTNFYEQIIKEEVAKGNIEMIDILSKKINLSSNPNLLEEILYIAILYMRNELIDIIINKYSIKIKAEYYIKCIYSSNYEGMLKIKEMDKEKAYNEYGINGSTPLDIAAFEGYLDFFKFILTFENIEIKKLNSYGKNVLQSATKSNKIDVIKYIVENKIIDPNDKGEYNATPLSIAKELNYEEAVSYLFKYTSCEN